MVTSEEIISQLRKNRVASSGAFKFFLPLDSTSVVLVKENHLGGTSISLSYHVKTIICLCNSIETALSVKSRMNKKHVENVFIIVGDASLSFSEGVFDLICFHNMDKKTFFLKQQKKRLREVYRCMKIDSCFYLSIDYYRISLLKYWQKLYMQLTFVYGYHMMEMKRIGRIHHYRSFDELHLVKHYLTKRHWEFSFFIFSLKELLFGNSYGVVLKKYKY